MTQEELEEKLDSINAAATAYEALIISPIANTNITYGKFLEYAEREFSRLGDSVSIILINYIYATIWCYSNTVAAEGDVIRIDLEKHGELGKDLVSKNLHLIGMYVFPLMLYGAEYIATAYCLFSVENLKEILDEKFPDIDDKKIAFDRLMSAIIEVAMQARFYHLRRCFVEEMMGNEEYRDLDFTGISLPAGKLIIPED
jgi:hypothetical protein